MNQIRKYNPAQLYIDGLLGQYSLGATNFTSGAASTGEIFQFRWVDSLRVCAIKRVTASMAFATGGALQPSPQCANVDLVRATAWTVQGTGGTVIDLQTGGPNKRRTGMPNSLVQSGDCRQANNGALGAGTKTLDANAMYATTVTDVAANVTALTPTRFLDYNAGDIDYPLVLAANEGFVIRVLNSFGGTAVPSWSICVDWIEANVS